jgi:hypothetical protein
MRTTLLVAVALFALPSLLSAETPPATVTTVLERFCVECHKGTKARGDLQLDTLPADFSKHASTWNKVLDRVTDGSMPPKGRPKPTEADQKVLSAWINEGLAAIDAARVAKEGRTVLRRLNRVEYANTLRDLLGIELDLTTQLPEDPTLNGFDNLGEALSLSSAHIERYLEGADIALDAALNLPPAPKPIKATINPHTPEALKLPAEKMLPPAITKGDGLVVFRNSLNRELFVYRTPAIGLYRFRIPLFGHNLDDKPYAVAVSTGTTSGAFIFNLVDYVDLTSKTQVFEFERRLPRGATLRLVGHGFPLTGRLEDARTYNGPGWGFGPIEVEGPLAKDWPPESRGKLLGKGDPNRGSAADAEIMLSHFLPRAFRHPTTAAEVAPYVRIVKDRLAKGDRYEAALRTAVKAVLCAPDFLFLREKPGPLDEFALASRLSYFLWNSMPDDALFEAARTGRLHDAKLLREQVERMLNDPRAHRFTEDFTGQWLGLRDIDFTTPDRKLYPEYDDRLHDSMLRETHLYFEEMIQRNRPVTEFVASDWTFLNGPLAGLYGVPGVSGQAMRKVTLPASSIRGGVLTQAAILKVTANGTTTSPVVRGTWVLDRILGQPTPPPPPGVPAIEPDTRGASTIRDQLAKHRTQENCAGCHRRIDPPGFALETFDAIGGVRDRYRVTLAPKQVATNFRTVHVQATNTDVKLPVGHVVESADVLPDGRRFKDVLEFKRLLLADKDQLTRNLVEKLATYATGAPTTRGDREAVEAVVAEVKKNEYGFRDLIHAVIQSPLFLRK